jgi:hypothetical protein
MAGGKLQDREVTIRKTETHYILIITYLFNSLVLSNVTFSYKERKSTSKPSPFPLSNKNSRQLVTIVKRKGPINMSYGLEAIQQNQAHQLPSMDFILF